MLTKIKEILETLNVKTQHFSGLPLPAILNESVLIVEDEKDDSCTIFFEIDIPKQTSINIYVKLVTQLQSLKLKLGADCFYIKDDQDKIQDILFGEQARTAYYSQIYDLVNVQESLEGITYH